MQTKDTKIEHLEAKWIALIFVVFIILFLASSGVLYHCIKPCLRRRANKAVEAAQDSISSGAHAPDHASEEPQYPPPAYVQQRSLTSYH